jgi:hypothetical protein
MFKVYIEESALNEPQPMEVSPDAPVARLVPALVDELQLPRTDLFGNRLVYFLRHADDGRVLPDHFSLRAAGVADEDYLSLESYIAEEASALATPSTQSAGQAPAFYADQTIADTSAFVDRTSGALPLPPPPLPDPGLPPRRNKRRWTRRALLMGGGAVLGLAGVGLAYAGLHVFSKNQGMNAGTMMPQTHPTMSARTSPATRTTPAQTFVPAHANAKLVFNQHQQTVRALAWSPDGTRLVSGGNDQQLLVWNTGGQVQINKGQNATIRGLTWSPDNQHFAAAAGTQVLFFNAQDGKVEATSRGVHNGLVMALSWSAKQPQYLVSAGLDKLAVVWNTQTFLPMTRFHQHTAGILAAGWAADGQTVATSSMGGVTRVWNGASGQEAHGFYLSKDMGGNGVSLDTLAFQPGGNMLAVGGMDGILRLWQNGLTCQTMGNGAMQGQCIDPVQHLSIDTQPIRALAWSPDGRFVATGGDDNMLLIWYPSQSQTPLLKIPQNAPVLALSWSPDGKMLAAASGKNVTLWALS